MQGFVSWSKGKTWFHVEGSLTAGVPAIVINGGPGSSSDYCKPFDSLSDKRAVIRYDQIDTGRSERVGDRANWTFETFILELETLVSHLEIEQYHLIGHSWGAMLALEYLKQPRSQVTSVTLASCMWDIPTYNAIADGLLKEISPIARIRATQLENAGKRSSAEYRAFNDEWTSRHIYTKGVVPDWTASFGGYNNELYNYMWGPSEFTVNGTMKEWSARDWMPAITTPTLIISGEHDEATPEHAKEAGELIPNSRVEIIEDASHFLHIEQTGATLDALRSFIDQVEKL